MGVDAKDFSSKERVEASARSRKIAIYLACELCGLSAAKVGKAFNQSLIAVAFAKKIILRDMREDTRFAETIFQLSNKIEAKNSPRPQGLERPGKSIKVKVSVQKDGPREIILTDCKGGVEDKTYYYNIIDYEGDMSDYVNITRHKTPTGAIREAKRFALDRNWAGPGTNAVYAGMPPMIVRTVKFVEMHRVEVKCPALKRPVFPREEPIIGKDGELDFKRMCKKRDADVKKFWKQFRNSKEPNEGKPHPRIGALPRPKV
ncbi:MAG: hypothetical protein A2X33_01080 [Elusimicrobia bacterium GWA2_51_34]|nr:MAG: hypothetical protein A2X33_01080 [Elusimicrobia bacterium GWA2_51_34]